MSDTGTSLSELGISPHELTTQTEVSNEDSSLKEKRNSNINEIVKSVATRGLVPAGQLHNDSVIPFGSYDAAWSAIKHISGVLVLNEECPGTKLSDWNRSQNGSGDIRVLDFTAGGFSYRLHQVKYPEDREETITDFYINRAFYVDSSSIFPVMMERPNERYGFKLLRKDVEERVQSNFLVVVDADNLAISNIAYNEAHTKQTIPPNSFAEILVPENLRGAIDEATFKENNIRYRYVGMKNTTVFLGDKSKQRDVDVPNYEDEIKTILAQDKKPIFLHAVRLPTLKDVSGRNVVRKVSD